MKQQGLDAATPKDKLDKLATQLWEATKELQLMNKQLKGRIKEYETRFQRTYMYNGELYMKALNRDIAEGPCAVHTPDPGSSSVLHGLFFCARVSILGRSNAEARTSTARDLNLNLDRTRPTTPLRRPHRRAPFPLPPTAPV